MSNDVSSLLRWARAVLSASPFNQTPGMDASLLLAKVLRRNRAQLYARLEQPVGDTQQRFYRKLVHQRCQGQPLAYLVGEKEFFSYTFAVGEGVLVPRPESELLVELALQKCPATKIHALELCCGTACIALSLARQRPCWQIDACDISAPALHYAHFNHRRLGGHVTFYQSDLFQQLPQQRYLLIVSNPPYLRSDEYTERQQKGWREPQLALDGGPDGLAIIRRIIAEAPKWLEPGGWLMLEASPSLLPAISILLADRGYSSSLCVPDLAGLPRVIMSRYP